MAEKAETQAMVMTAPMMRALAQPYKGALDMALAQLSMAAVEVERLKARVAELEAPAKIKEADAKKK